MKTKSIRAGTLVSDSMAAALARWQRIFYGLETPKGGHPAGLGPALTGYLSTLVTAENTVTVSGGVRAAWLQKQLALADPLMQRAVQLAAAEGQCVLRPLAADGGLRVELIPAFRFFPVRYGPGGTVTAGFFGDFRTRGSDELIRLERFDLSGGTLTVTNRAYLLRGDGLHKEIPLDTLEEWGDLEKETVIEGISGPLFGVLRMPFANTVDPDSPLPVSLYAGAEQSIREFDRLYGELLYELHSGKRKRILERQALPGLTGNPIPGAPGYQDLATDTYLVLDPMEQQKPFDDYSPVMRTEEYLAGLKNLLHLIENQCRLSPGALSLEVGGDRPVTATEVVSRDRTTYHTCGLIQQQALLPAIRDLAAAMDALADLYGLCPPGDYTLDVTFGDSVFEDTGTEFERQLRLAQAGILLPEQLLSWYYHVDRETARNEYLQKGAT